MICLRYNKFMFERTFLGLLVAIACIIAYWWYQLVWPFLNPENVLEIHALDVGQGDSILIKTPSDKQLLIDAGRGVKVLSRLSEVIGSLDRTLDVAIYTHPDADHIGGFIPALDLYDIDYILQSYVTSNTSVFKKLLNSTKKEGAIVKTFTSPHTFSLDGVNFYVLWPVHNKITETNTASLVILVEYGEIKALFTGDAPIIVEEELLNLYPKLLKDIDILKLGHHGSDTSTSSKFLNHTKPNILIISAGAQNSYGHPNKNVIARVEKYIKDNPKERAAIYETKDGTISVCISKTNFYICD